MRLCSAFWYLAVMRAAVRRRRSASLLLLQEPLPGQVQGSPRPEAPLPLGPGAHLVFDLEAERGKKWVDLHDSSSEILFSIGKNTLTHTLVEQHHQLWCLTQFTSGCHANKNQKQPFPLCAVPSCVLMYPHPHCWPSVWKNSTWDSCHSIKQQ